MAQASDNTVPADVAESLHRERMHVDTPGRAPFQKIFVRGNKDGKKTTTKYNPTSDQPRASSSSSLPTPEELQESPNTVQMLVVGLIIADDPSKYSRVGVGARYKSLDNEREARGVLPQPDKVLRALVPVTEHIEKSANYYAAVNLHQGLCDLKVIRLDMVFFFSEFHASLTTEQSLKVRRPALGIACRTAAALNKEPLYRVSEDESQGAEDAIQGTEDDTQLSEHELMEPTGESQATEQATFPIERISMWSGGTLGLIEGAHNGEDITDTPDHNSIQHFFDESTEVMTITVAIAVLDTFKDMHPRLSKISPGIIVNAHKILKEQGTLTIFSESSQFLPIFLRLLSLRVDRHTPRSTMAIYVREAVENTRAVIAMIE